MTTGIPQGEQDLEHVFERRDERRSRENRRYLVIGMITAVLIAALMVGLWATGVIGGGGGDDEAKIAASNAQTAAYNALRESVDTGSTTTQKAINDGFAPLGPGQNAIRKDLSRIAADTGEIRTQQKATQDSLQRVEKGLAAEGAHAALVERVVPHVPLVEHSGGEDQIPLAVVVSIEPWHTGRGEGQREQDGEREGERFVSR